MDDKLNEIRANHERKPLRSLKQEFMEGTITPQQFLHEYVMGLPSTGHISTAISLEMETRINKALMPLVYEILKGKLTIHLNE